MQQDVEIIRWSGIWRKGDEVRVGVRLADGRDALLVAFLGREAAEPAVHYTLVIQGVDYEADFIIPADLEKRVESKLLDRTPAPKCRSLKDLKLF